MKCPHCERNACPAAIAEEIGWTVTRARLIDCRNATARLAESLRLALGEANERTQQLADLLAADGRVR